MKCSKLDVCTGVHNCAPVNDVSFMQVVETSKDLLHNAFHLRATTKQYQLPK